MPTRSANTMVEMLQKTLADISQMKTLPDADLEFLVNLETQVLKLLRAPIDQLQQKGLTSVPTDPMAGGGGGGGDLSSIMAMLGGTGAGGGGAPMPAAPPPGMGMQRAEPPMPAPDEMRRMLQQ